MPEQRLMKDGLGAQAINRIADAMSALLTDFPRQRFTNQAMNGLETLELKERVGHLIRVLHEYLPSDFTKTAELLLQIKKHWDYGTEGDALRGFAAWPIIDYVGVYGLDHPDTALDVLKYLTPLFSSELAIRPFIIRHLEITYPHLLRWTVDSDHHVRRLASEGSRPRLPWAPRIPAFLSDPSPVLEILEHLKDDPSEYVRRSVANNLNDISKDHPNRVTAKCKEWKKGASKDRQWIIRHATRTLVKAGHPDVFDLLGYTPSPELSIKKLKLDKNTIHVGEDIMFYATIKSTAQQSQRFVLDYAVHHVKHNGSSKPKVFKLKTLTLTPGETVEVSKKHSLRQISTRTYYPGTHTIELLVNGRPRKNVSFELLSSS